MFLETQKVIISWLVYKSLKFFKLMDDSNQDITLKAFKVILVGMQSVGKSSILCRLVNSQLPQNYQATVGIDYHTYSAMVDNKSYSLQIWDTAGQ